MQGAGRTFPERSTTRDTMRTPIRDAPMQQSPKTSANCVFSRCEKPNDSAAEEEENSTCRQHTNLHHAEVGHPADCLDHLGLWKQGPEKVKANLIIWQKCVHSGKSRDHSGALAPRNTTSVRYMEPFNSMVYSQELVRLPTIYCATATGTHPALLVRPGAIL